eukprot:gb/GECH01010584.1/.p1 GENE.gb/GECH01010584.1/~~gb/GECH01010584.1/.p1  ORF type:complete len:433 (+),score=123.13 gb/GECH01010584.1/:1-1299(+)
MFNNSEFKNCIVVFSILCFTLLILPSFTTTTTTNTTEESLSHEEEVENIHNLLATIETRIQESITLEKNQTEEIKNNMDQELQSLKQQVLEANSTLTDKELEAEEKKRLYEKAQESVSDAEEDLTRLKEERNYMKKEHDSRKQELNDQLETRKTHLQAELEIVERLRNKLEQLLHKKIQDHNEQCNEEYGCSPPLECRYGFKTCKFPAYHECVDGAECVSGECSKDYRCMPKSCFDIYQQFSPNISLPNGDYMIHLPENQTHLEVYCDMEDGGYTLVAFGQEHNIIGFISPESHNIHAASFLNDTFKFSDEQINMIRGVEGIYRLQSTGDASKTRFASSNCIYSSTSITEECLQTWSDEDLTQDRRAGQDQPGIYGVSDMESAGLSGSKGYFGTSVPDQGWLCGDLSGIGASTTYAGNGGITGASGIRIWVK